MLSETCPADDLFLHLNVIGYMPYLENKTMESFFSHPMLISGSV